MSASGRIECVGGPLDGVTAGAVSGQFAWVARGGKASARPTNGRALYQRTKGTGRVVYVYAGHKRWYCNGCGCYHLTVEGGSERPPCALGRTL